MAQFRVGQRVRIIDWPGVLQKHWVGCEVMILGLPGAVQCYPNDYEISRPSTARGLARSYSAPGYVLVPLTDPGADAFMERIRKLGDEPNNVVEKEKVER